MVGEEEGEGKGTNTGLMRVQGAFAHLACAKAAKALNLTADSTNGRLPRVKQTGKGTSLFLSRWFTLLPRLSLLQCTCQRSTIY